MCVSCGNEFPAWSGKCPACGEWNSLKEVTGSILGKEQKRGNNGEVISQKLLKVELKDQERLKTGIDEFDRVLGGGIVKGSLILMGGEPGIGKSTLLLQVANKLENPFYISAEESAGQIKLRADRLNFDNEKMDIVADGNLESVLPLVKKANPSVLIVDSIQTVFLSSFDATAGSLLQVREAGIYLQNFAKSSGIAIILVGHVTKEGNLAGPRILEHLVDTVLYLEGDRFADARILRGVKNRFGPTNEVGVFSMEKEGMREVKNPSELFLSEYKKSPGSVVAVVLEGTRPLLVEIQALVAPTHFGYPKRTSSGFDLNRLNLLAAVISKQTETNLANSDIYLNVVGGLKISEPACDFAVCAAIISSYKNRALPQETALFGEVGLIGEIRRVSKQEDRIKEAKALGFDPVFGLKDLRDITKLFDR